MATTDHRLLPSRRVKHRQDFLRIQKTGKKVRTKHFLLAFLPSASGDSRIGVTVTRKVDKRAARRNRLQRRVREIFRKEREQLQRQVDLVVIALSGATQLGFPEIEHEVMSLLKRARLR